MLVAGRPRGRLRGMMARAEDLAAPDSVRFAAFRPRRLARSAERAGLAVRSGQLQVGRQIGELQLRVLALAYQRATDGPCLPDEQGHSRPDPENPSRPLDVAARRSRSSCPAPPLAARWRLRSAPGRGGGQRRRQNGLRTFRSRYFPGRKGPATIRSARVIAHPRTVGEGAAAGRHPKLDMSGGILGVGQRHHGGTRDCPGSAVRESGRAPAPGRRPRCGWPRRAYPGRG